jgi:hypothetical protein
LNLDPPDRIAALRDDLKAALAEVATLTAERGLPPGGETWEERGVVHDDLGEFHRCREWATCTRWYPHVHGHTRTVTTWPDGSTLTSGWRPVDTEETKP